MRHADRVRAGRAGGHEAEARPLRAEVDRDRPGHHVDDAAGDEERADLLHAAAVIEEHALLLDRADAADANAIYACDRPSIGLKLVVAALNCYAASSQVGNR